MASALLFAAVLAVVLPRSAHAVPATVAVAVSIPFMATSIPYSLGGAVLTHTRAHTSRTMERVR
ncbi:hypothetical protein [Nocardia sp. NPDC005366]|uniref:hypothetical protein n=1 Tax=Nocardia sp. NPDC005366 TaxID=3156878 RepID=UPI0033A89777